MNAKKMTWKMRMNDELVVMEETCRKESEINVELMVVTKKWCRKKNRRREAKKE
jgi:hypothetical protein